MTKATTRLSVLLLASSGVFLGALGCQSEASEAKATQGRQRSEVVLAKGPASGSATADDASEPVPRPVSTKQSSGRRSLCSPSNQTELPATKVGGRGRRSSPFAGGRVGGGGLTWVNLWAAWCEPCKKEMPVIRALADRLRVDGLAVELAFVSLDDDERQLQRFLDDAGHAVRETYWLREGEERDEWLAEAELPSDPRLPVHLLVDASGQIVCRVDGAIEESDYPAVRQVFER